MKHYLQFKVKNLLDSLNFDLTQQSKSLNADSVNQFDLELNSKSVVKAKKSNLGFVFFFTLLFSLFGFVQNATSQTTISQWTFEPLQGTNANPTPNTGSGSATLVGSMTGVGTGTGMSGTGCGTQTSGTLAWAIGTANPGTTNESSGAQFNVSTVGRSGIIVQWDQRFSNTATNTVRLQYTTDGSSWNNFTMTASNTTLCGGSLNNGRFENNAGDLYRRVIVDLSAITSVNNNANFGFRAVAAHYQSTGQFRQANTPASVATAGTWRFDNVTVSGSVISTNPIVNLSVSNNAGTEAGTTAITVTATATAAVTSNQTVNLAVTGTGITGTDYALSNTSITILSGATTGTVTFTVADDTDVEGTEMATLTISGPSSGITLGTTTAQNITITDNDVAPPPTVQLSVSSNTGTEAGATVLTVTATASSAVTGDQTINLGVTGTNITTGDFALSNSVITILNGQTTGSVTFTVVDDALFEVEETATLTISSPSSGIALGVTTTQNITITDNDVAPPPTVQLSVSSNTGTEAAATVLTVTATASYAVTGDQTVNLAVTGTGITTADYSLSNTQITILSGSTTGSVTFTILDDAADEGTETARLTISNPSLGITLGTTIAQNISITDNDAPPVTIIEAGDISVIGYNLSGTPNDNFTILFHKDLNSGTVFYINDNEIATAGSSTFTDLNEGEISFTVKPGQTIAKGTVISIPWGAIAVSTSTYDLSSGSGAGLGSSGDELYIYNASSITATTASSFICFAKIGNSPSAVPAGLISGTTSITPTLVPASRYKISGALYNACQADLLVAIGNTATNWEAVAPGAASDWTFTLLSTCAPVIPTVALSISTNAGSEAGTTAITVTATSSSAVSTDETVTLGVSGTNITSGDYSLSNSVITIVNGQTSGSVTFTVVDDVLVEGSETAVLTISNPSSGLTLGTTTSQNITITDNDVAPNLNIDLSTYVRVGRYNLPEPTRTAAPTNNLLCQEASAVAYNWDTDTLFITADGSTSITQVSKTGELINTMTMAQGGSPQGTEFYDTEGLTYIGNGQFVMSEERDRQLVKFTYAAGTTLTRANTQTVKIGTFVPNTGTEGLSYDPLTGGYIVLKEITPIGIFQTGVDFNAGTATNGSATTENSTNLFDPALLGVTDVADVFALSNVSALNGQSIYNNLLVLSQENAKVVNINRSGVIANTLTIVSDAGNPLDVASQQHEGLTMDNNGILYIVSENGGGTIDYPQLWVYAPSTVPNQAPTAIALTNTTTAILENSNTTAAVKVADITVTDDGLGTNNLTLSGADANSFQIIGSSLYIKAGTVLDYETQISYSVTINVDDTTIGTTPDASVNFVLNVTDVLVETTPIVSVSISEVAPWSSSTTSVLADWFEVTNNGSTALDITGWKVDDNSNSFTAALALTGITSIAPGESVIFLETTSTNAATIIANFKSAWFGANVPAGLQVGSYTGTGIGLSSSGDAVNLFDASGTLKANVTFAASTTNFTFNNAAGLNNAAVSTLSIVGVNEAFSSANGTNQVGSPGTIGRLFISEVAPWSSGSSPVAADWFEVTNTKAVAVDITGWKVDDNSQSPAAAVALNGITSINPGESVIFIETADLAGKTTAFLNNWFGTNPSSGLRFGNYTGSGIGLGTGGDQVNLYNGVSSTPVSSVLFGASPTAAPFTTFDNAIGQNSLVTPITQFSAVSVNGAFIAANSTTEIGSPGTIKTAPCPTITATATPALSTVCFGATTTVTVTPTGGTLPYTVTGSPLTVGGGTFTYTITDAKGCTATATTTVTSLPAATVDLSVTTNTASETAGTIVTVTATASAAVCVDETIAVNVTGSGITAADYTLSNATITIPAGSTTGSVTFTVVSDNAVEALETAEVTISNPSSGIALGTTTTQNITISDYVFKLQVLHASDFEAAVDAVQDAPRFAAIVDVLEDTYANTIKLSSGDNYIPGPFLSSGEDSSLSAALKTSYESYYNTTFSSSAVNLLPSIGRADISILNFIGIEASALGNHEFDLGTTEVRNIIRGANSSSTVRSWFGAQFPYLSSNLNFSGDSNLSAIATTDRLRLNTSFKSTPSEAVTAITNKTKLAPSTIIMKGGQKIGIVGCTTQVLASISSPGATTVVGGGANDMTILAGIIQPVVNSLIADGCNKIILLSHLQQIAFEKELAGKLTGVDIIMAGGSNTLMADANDRLRAGDVAAESYPFLTTGLDGKALALINTDGNYKYVGRLVVDFDADGTLIPSSIDPVISGVYAADSQGLNDVWGANVANAYAVGTRGYQVQLLCTAVANVINVKDGNLFGKTAVFLEGRRNIVRTEETNLGNLSAEANLWMAKFYDPTTVISIKNGGGIRSAIGNVIAVGNDVTYAPPIANVGAGKQAGDISQLDIENSLRFNNKLSLVTLTATGLRSILENAVAGTTATATPGQFAQVAGVRYSYNFSNAVGSRILNAVVTDTNGNIIDTLVLNGVTQGNLSRTFRVVTLNFLAGGGDSYPFNTLGTSRVDLDTVAEQGPAMASFAIAGSEQDAFAEYMKNQYTTTPYGIMDTALVNDCRIQRIPARTDNVLPPNAGTNGALLICNGATLTTSELFAALGGTPVSGGTWSPEFSGAGVYTYTVTSPSCSGVATATTTVTSLPAATVDLSVTTNTASETAGTIVTVTATASAAVCVDETIAVNVTGSGITAADYTLSNATITIPAGSTTGSVTFTVVSDNAVEALETAEVTISNPSSGIALGTTTTQNITISDYVFKLQVLHASDFEAAVDAVQDAPRFAAIVDVLEDTYANTIKLSSGDNYIPGPFLSSGEDSSLSAALKTSYESYYNTTFSSSAVNLLPSIGRADISILNFIGIEASALGNHEFDLGTTEVRNIIRGANSSSTVRSWFGAQFPYLSSNLNFSGDSNLSAIATTDRLRLNTSFKSTPSEAVTAITNKTKLAPSTIIMKGGQKIGIVGCTTQVLASISSPGATTVVGGGANDMTILAGIIQPVVNSLIADGCNKIILLSHLQQIAFEKELAGKLTGVDIIMAGGSNTLMADANDRLRAGDVAAESYPFLTTGLDGKALALINTDGNYKYVGRLVVDFDADGTLIPSSIDPVISGVYAADSQGLNDVWGANVANAYAVGTRGYQVQLLCTAVANVINVKDGNLFGKTAVFLEGRRNIVRTEETNLGNLSAEANLWMAKFYDPTTVISIKNGGGIRSAIGNVIAVGNDVTYAPPIANVGAGKQAGDISQLDIENSLRFNNKLSLVTLTATGLRSILENAVAGTTATATPGQFAQVAGVRYSYNFSNAVGSRILNAVVTDTNGNIIDTLVLNGVTQGNLSRTFRVVTLNFLAGGGDSYPFNTLGTSRVDLDTVAEQGPAMASFAIAGSEQDAFAEYMKNQYTTTPYGIMDTALVNDCRIQRIPARTDNVLPPNAGTNGALLICNGATLTTSELFAALGGTPVSGGTWSPEFSGAGVYTYTVTSPSCSGVATATVTVTESGITTQPTNPTICKLIGATASTSVTASGSVTYQWQMQTATGTSWSNVSNNANYAGATSATLAITRTSTSLPETGTKYRVIVTSCGSSVTSSQVALAELAIVSKAATITAKSATNTTLSPALTTCEGTTVNLSLAAGSIGNVQWEISTTSATAGFTPVGSLIQQSALSAVNPLLSFTTPTLTQDTWFRVVATNGVCSSATSAAIKINVSTIPTAGTIAGGDVTVCAPLVAPSSTVFDVTGSALANSITNSTTLSLEGTTSGTTIVWERSINFVNATNAAPVWSTVTNVTATTATGASYSGAGTGELVVGNLAATTWFRARVINGACSVITDEVKITVSPAAKAGTVTSPTTVCTGGSITFTSAVYTGSAIAWQVSTTSATSGFETVAGANELTFTMDNVTLVAPGQKFYVRSVVSSGACTQARSAVRTVTVDPTSVAGTVTGAGIVCSGGGATLRLAGNVGLIQWEYSADGVDYVNVPTATVGSASTFSTTSANGTSATYVLTNVTAGTYFRAKVKSGSCSASYTTPVQMVIGTEAVAGTATAASSTICAASGTTITLTGNIGAIQWQKSSNWTAATPTWTAVTNATASTLATGNLTASTAFKAVVTIGSCSTVETTPVIITVNLAAKGGTAAIATTNPGATICTGSSKTLTVTGNVGSIQWQMSTTSATEGFENVSGATSSPYTFTNITQNAWFRAVATSGVCTTTANSTFVAITVTTIPAVAGTISGNNSVCTGTGSTLTLEGSTGSIVWQKAVAPFTTWAAISGQTSATLATGNLSATTAFRAILTSGSCTATTSAYVVTVSPLAKAASVTGHTGATTAATAICTSATRTLTLGTGTVGTIQWQFYNAGTSTTAVSATTASSFTWTDIAGATSSVLAASSAATGNVWFRVKMTSGPCSVVYSTPVNVWFKSCGSTREEAPITIFTVKGYPNPYSTNFTLSLDTPSDSMVYVSVFDMTGKLIENREVMPSALEDVQLGSNWSTGVYNVIVSQGEHIKSLRVIKN